MARFLLTADAIGILFKENASISGAEVGLGTVSVSGGGTVWSRCPKLCRGGSGPGTGNTQGTFSGVPAFSGTDGYFANGSALFCENVKTLTPVFTAPVPSTIVACPVIAGQRVYVGTANAGVYALSTTNGEVVWHGALPGVPGGGGEYSSPPSDIAVGQGLLVVPTGKQVTAFG